MCRFNNRRFPPDGFLTSGRGKNGVGFASNLLSLEIEDHGPILTKAEEINTMISGEDESSSVINGRLRPRKSTANIPNPPNKSTHKPENKVAQDRPKRNSIPSKALPNKQDDLTAKADSLPLAQLLCPYCDKKFTTKLAASKHSRRIHLNTAKQDNFINCLFCNHSEAVSSNIIRHMVDSHPNQYFACLDCNTRFFSTSELAEHKLNVCEKQKQAYRSKLRQKTSSSVSKKDQKKINTENKIQYAGQNKELKIESEFNGLVISCELKSSHAHDAVDIEDNITTNLILPSNLGNTVLEKNALMILDDIQWNRRIPPNFSFRNADADQILSRLGVVHRSPRVGESTRREWLKMIDASSQKFEKCFDTNFYSRVASNVQQNLARFLDGSFNFSPDPDKVIKTRKSKNSAIINTAEGFPILLPHEQYSRNRFDGYMPRAIAPKHKWKWDSTENEKHIIIDASVMKRDNHVDNCIITLVSSLDIWTQLRMRHKFEEIFCKAAIEKFEKQNIIGKELKEILESREIPSSSSQVVDYSRTSSTDAAIVGVNGVSDFPSFLGLTARSGRSECPVQPAVLSGEWVRPRCYVCCACGDQTRDSRALTAHMAAHHPNAQVQHYEIVGESLLNADILKHLYVPPSQISNRTRPLRGYRDCTKCKKSITIEDLHQHMLDCAGDTPTVRRKCRSRPFGVRRRRPRLPDNSIRKKVRKDLRTRHNQKVLLRTRPRIRTEVGDAETIRKMIADLPAKRHRQAAGNLNTQQVLRPRRKLDKQRNKLKIKRLASKNTKTRKIETKNYINDSSIIDEDDQPLKPKTKIEPEKTVPAKKRSSNRVLASKTKKVSSADKEASTIKEHRPDALFDDVNALQVQRMSNEANSTQKLDINAKDNVTRGEESRDGAVSYYNDDDRKMSPLKGQDKDNHKSVAPTLLKHSINSITASSNKSSQSLQQNFLPQQANEADTLRDTRNTFLENVGGPSLPEKPQLQLNLKRSSQKKRESLLNCIEKIKAKTTEQKGETMYDHRHAYITREDSIAMQCPNVNLMDPTTALTTFGPVNNGVPNGFVAPPMNASSGPYQSQEERRYGWLSDIEVLRKANEMKKLNPMAEPFYAHKKPPETEFSNPRAKAPARQRRKSSSARLSMAHNEQVAQQHMANMYYQSQLKFGSLPYTSIAQAHLQHQIEQSRRMPFPTMYPQQHHLNEAFKNAQYKNQSLLALEQYNTPDLHYEGRRGYIPPPRNESMNFLQQNQNSLTKSLSSQLPIRECMQTQQMNNNLTLPNIMLPSMAASELVIPSTQRTLQIPVSDSFGTGYAYGNSRNMMDPNMLNYVNSRRMSSDNTANTYHPPAGQGSGESCYHALARFRAQTDIRGDKNTDFMTLMQDRYGNKIKKSDENKSGFSASTSKGAEHYRTAQSHTTPVNDQLYTPRVGEEKHPSKLCSENNIDESYLLNRNYIIARGMHFSNIKKLLLQENHMPKIVPIANIQAAKITPPPNELSTPNSVGRYTHDQIDDIPNCSNRDIDHHLNHDSYIEVEDHQGFSENQTDFGSNDEPLDLSAKHVPDICNNDTLNVCIENEQQGTINTRNAIEVHSNVNDGEQMTVEIDSIENNASNLSIQDHSASIDAYANRQVSFTVDENNTVENRVDVAIHYKETNERKSSHDEYIHVPNTFPRQISDERENNNENYHNESMIISNVNDIEKSKLDSQTSGVSSSPNDNYYFTGNVTPYNQISDGRENDNENYHNESLVVSNVNDIEKPKLDSQTSGVSASPNDNCYCRGNIKPFNQISDGRENDNENYHNEALIVSNVNYIEKSKLDSQTSGVSASPNDNYYCRGNIISFNQISDGRENDNGNYHNASLIVSNVNDIEKSKLDSQTSGVSASPNDNYYFTGNVTPYNQISDGRENENENYHNESLIVSNVNDIEKSKLDSQTSGVSASPNDNNYFTTNITPFNQISDGRENENENYHNESLIVSNVNDIEKSKLDLQTSGVSASPNDNNYCTGNITSFNQISDGRENDNENYHNEALIVSNVNDIEKSKLDSQTSGVSASPNDNNYCTGNITSFNPISDGRENDNENYHNESLIVSNVNDIEKSKLDSQTSGVSASPNDNNYCTGNITPLNQISDGRENDNENYHNESLIVSNVNDIEKSILDSQTEVCESPEGVSASPNDNNYFTRNITPNNRLDENNEESTTVLKSQSLLQTTEAIAVNRIKSINILCHPYNNTEGVQIANHSSSINNEPNTSFSGIYNEQNNAQRDLHSAELTSMQNQMPIDEKTSVDNSNVNNNTNEKTPSDKQYPVMKLAILCKELVALLVRVPDIQHKSLIGGISEIIPLNKEKGLKLIITVQESQNVTQGKEAATTNTLPICDTSSNTENRLTINAAALPSSSILPKKRHSPSARFTTQDPYSNMTLLKSSPMLNQSTSIMRSIPNRTSVENAIAANSSTGIMKRISENECEFNPRHGKIIEVTVDDFGHPKPNSQSPTSNIMQIQESVSILRSSQKNSSEKTASLRAVRIKTPLSRKSISDCKQLIINKEIYSRQLNFLHSKQRHLNMAQIFYPGCGYTKVAIDNAVVQNPEYPEYHGSTIINQAEKRTTQSVARIGSEASNYMSTADCDLIKQSEMGAATSNFVAKKDAISESKSSTFYGNSQDIFFTTPNPLTALSSDKDTVVPDSANLIYPEQSRSDVANTLLVSENNMGGQMNPQVDDINQNLKSNKNSVTIIPLEPQIIQNNESKGITSTTNFSEDEDSDDDVLLAYIVKQKPQGQTDSSRNDASTSAVVENNRPLRPDPEETKKHKSINKIIKKSTILHPTDYQLLTINNKLNYTVCIEPTVESEIDDANKNDVNRENHEIHDFEHRNEDDVRVSLDNTLVENIDLPPVLDVPNKENIYYNIIPTMMSNDDTEVDSFHDLSKKKSLNGDIESNLKSKISDSDIETPAQNTDTNGPHLEFSELHSNVRQEESLSQYFKAGQENNSLTDESNNLIKIQNTQSELESLSGCAKAVSAIKQRANEVKTSKPVEFILAESRMPTELNETSERALRRSRRARSIYLNNTDLSDHNINNTVDSQTANQKIPVPKKQLIFSKFLLDEITHAKNESGVISDPTAETKAFLAKRKKSPGKITSKKNKIYDMEKGGKNSAKLNCTSDNNKNTTAKEPPCYNASIETFNRSIDTGAIENDRTFEFTDDESTNDVLVEKQKSNSLTKNVRTKINDETFVQQDPIIHVPPMNAENEINDTGRTKSRLESSKVKSVERRIENTVAGISGYSDLKKQPEKTNTCVEIRTACYNRPIVSKQIGLTMSVENPKNYDPYDINLDIDMAETSRPLKRKSKKSVSGSLKISKKGLSYENHTDKIIHKTGIEKPEIAVPGTSPPSLSDSDSSISDVPLQKYVEEKEKLKIEELKSANCNKPKNNSEPNSLIDASEENKMSELASQNLNQNIIIDNTEYVDKSDLGITNNTVPPPTNSRDETDDVAPCRNDETAGIKMNQSADQIENTANSIIVKSNNKQKKKRQSTTTKKTSKLSNKIEKNGEQPSDEKCPENIGFYSVRQQRKSNLLAAKKISETFNMMASYDADFRPRGRPRNSSHNDNRRITDADHTSRAAIQDATNANSYSKKSTTATPHIEELHADPSSAVDEPLQANDDGEVDLITAERMLNSEEIRKLERDLYSGFKEAAQANAGRTSGFNQLRAEEVNPRQINDQDVSTLTVVEVEIKTIQSAERPESPERSKSPDRSESPDRPDSPESLKDKPLMYPEEEVNIYEDKYDIIKRRREASAIAKQIQKVDQPKKSKPEKIKKKPERKSYKKPTKKPTYQVSQVSQVPTKAALKVFDGFKVSILTQDLNLPPSVSPPNRQQQHSKFKKRKIPLVKARANSSSSYKNVIKPKIVSASDIYEFQDDERPVTKGYRLSRVIDKSRSSSLENEEKSVKVNRNTKDKNDTKPTEESNLRDQEIEKSKTKKGKGKGKGKGKEKYDKTVNKTVTPHEKDRVNQKEKQTEEIDLKIAKVTDGSQTEQRVYNREKLDVTPLTDDYRLSNDYSDTLGNIQDKDEPFNDSEPEDQTVMPGTSGFVPDRNDESSYDSDSSSPTPLLSVLSPYACTCLSEIDSDDSETERGCAHTSCRYSHLNAAKIAVMGKIFKNNAVRCDKSDDTLDEPPKPKPDLDRLFDSLLEPTTDSSEIALSANKSPVAGSVSATYFFTNHVKVPLEALQPKKNLYEKDVSTVDDGFSSSNDRDSSEEASPNDTNLLKRNDYSTKNFDKTTTAPVDSLYIMVSQKKIQRVSTESSDEPTEEKTPKPSNTNLNDKTKEDVLDNLEKVSDSSDRFKYKQGDVRKTRGSQKKRVAPESDVESSSCEDELNTAKLPRRNRRTIKKHKTHHKRKETSDEDEPDKRLSDNKNTSTPKRTRKPRKTVDENETESGKKQLVKLSPSRKSDEQNQTDIVPAEEIGVAMQRARRKCTVGKQNVLAEHWSSSESETEPNRAKGRKKIGRTTKGSRRSREADNDDSDEEAGTRPPAPKTRARAVVACGNFDAARKPKNKKELEQHGWIVGVSHKKLVTMLVCSKSKARPGQADDDDEDDEHEKKAIENAKDEEKEKKEEE